ncbi:hypothetical protein ACFLT1_04900 [Bacteroidota bacterium]
MSDLEKYMVENRSEFSSDEPGRGHMNRFNKKLGKKTSITRSLNIRHTLQIAASIAVILASGIVIVKSSKGSTKVADNPVIEEFQEAKTYYATQVNTRYEDIADFQFTSAEEKKILLEELTVMDTYYKELLQELDVNPGDERAMNALIQHYRIKIEVMDQIIEQLIEVKNSNIKQNEETTL